MCGWRTLPTYLCACVKIQLVHVHILLNHVTSSISASWRICYLFCSFARKGSQEKTLRIGSPPSGKYLWATSTPERHPFAFSRPPYVSVSVQFSLRLILPCCCFEAAHCSGCWTIASRVSGLSVVSTHVQWRRERKFFSSGSNRFQSPPACTHARTDNCNLKPHLYVGLNLCQDPR